MIKLQDYTPDVYYNESRDFQFIGRLYDIVLNYVKTNADLLYDLPLSDNSDSQFIELLAFTLGFQPKHKYTAKHLRAICSVFSDILRNKGTIKSVLIACYAIFNAEGIDGGVEYELLNNGTHFKLYLPPELKDTTLLIDILNYIIPAGMSFDLTKTVLLNSNATTEIDIKDTLKLFEKDNTNNKPYIYDNTIYTIIPKDLPNGKVAESNGKVLHDDTNRTITNSTIKNNLQN